MRARVNVGLSIPQIAADTICSAISAVDSTRASAFRQQIGLSHTFVTKHRTKSVLAQLAHSDDDEAVLRTDPLNLLITGRSPDAP